VRRVSWEGVLKISEFPRREMTSIRNLDIQEYDVADVKQVGDKEQQP
jgi:hypothetical protein